MSADCGRFGSGASAKLLALDCGRRVHASVDRRCGVIDRWSAAIADRLGLDELEAGILALALHCRLDQRVERLFDNTSECRGGATRFHRDAALLALLLGAPAASVARRLTAGAKLLASRLLELDRHGELSAALIPQET